MRRGLNAGAVTGGVATAVLPWVARASAFGIFSRTASNCLFVIVVQYVSRELIKTVFLASTCCIVMDDTPMPNIIIDYALMYVPGIIQGVSSTKNNTFH